MKRESELDDTLTQSAAEQEMWLLGQAPLRKYLDFVVDIGCGPKIVNRTPLVQEWSAAALWYEELAKREPGVADKLDCRPLDPALAPLADEVLSSARFTRSFNHLPSRLAMVELARLVVCQNHVTRSFVDRLKQRLGPHPDPAALFRFCLPSDDSQAPVQIRELGARRYEFRSDSTDFRFHEPVLLKPQQLTDYAAFGSVAAALGLVVGYGSNFLNAVCDDDSGRLVLHNGYHRACALLELGITHAPCVVQTVTSRDELDLVGKPIVVNDPGYFFNAPRPPLLRDFADPRIRKILPIRKVSRVIEVSFEVRDYMTDDYLADD
ncbi:hypothetical protein [Massilia niastensis]|uniref:hypothetical protein n=1 Tax=Massilia niastensis TaxID=544911 RepID=UPI0003631FCE|nr:hypothetical protein [Massilia niastensis]